MFDCGIIVLQNKVSSSKIFVVLHHHIPGSINYHTITMVKKVNYNEKRSKISAYNDYDNRSSESQTAKEQASFMKQLESKLYWECAKCIGMQ